MHIYKKKRLGFIDRYTVILKTNFTHSKLKKKIYRKTEQRKTTAIKRMRIKIKPIKKYKCENK